MGRRDRITGIQDDALDKLREQYRDALESERRATKAKGNAKQEREAAEESLIRARTNAHLDASAEVQVAVRVTDALLKERAADDRVRAARKDLKASTIAYWSHLDERKL